MKRRLLALAWPLTCAACTTVEIVPQDGGGTPTAGGPSSGGFDASGGAGTGVVGGAPMGGAPEPGVVPGCEALEITGEPLFLPTSGPPFDSYASLAALDDGRVGLVYMNGWADGAELLSRTIDGAFESWPPVVSEATTQYEGFITTDGLVDSALPNGLVGIHDARGIFSFDQGGVVRELEAGWFDALLHPGAGTPFEVVSFGGSAESYKLLSFDSLDAATPTSVDLPVSGCRTTRMAVGDGDPLYSIATDWYCEDAPRVDFFRKGSGGVELVAGFDLPIPPVKQSLAPRPGGYWYFTSSIYAGIGSYAYPLDESGALVGEPWVDEYTYGDFSPQFLPWRDGFLGSHREDGALSLFVSDGFNRTDSQPIPGTGGMQAIASATALAMAIGGENSGSILVAYPVVDGILLARLQCFTPFK